MTVIGSNAAQSPASTQPNPRNVGPLRLTVTSNVSEGSAVSLVQTQRPFCRSANPLESTSVREAAP